MSANLTIVRQLVPNLSIKQISIILTIIAFALWSYSILQVKLDIGYYGLINGLPVLFFVALALLTIASALLWRSPSSESKLLFLQLCLLIVSLWLTPTITGGSQPFVSVPYWLWGHSEYIMREGHLIHPAISALWYHNWPGAMILTTILCEVLGIDNPDALIELAPFVLQFVYLPFLYLFLRNTLGKNKRNYIWAGLWIFQLGSWTAFTYFISPPSVAYIFFLFMILVFIGNKSGAVKTPSFGTRLGNIIIIASLAITHLLTNIVIVTVGLALQIFRRIKAWNFLLIGIVFAVAWTLYGAVAYFDAKVPEFVENAFRIDRQLFYGTVARVSGSESHQAVALTRIITTAIFLGIAVFGYLLSRRQKVSIFTDNTVLAIAAGSAIGIAFVGGGYGFELVMRVFFYMLPVIAYFSVKLLNKKVTALILCFILIVLLPMHFVSHYGNAARDYFSQSHLSALHFFEEYRSSGSIIGGYPLGATKNAEDHGAYDLDRIDIREQLQWDETRSMYVFRDWGTLQYPNYICISERDKATDNFRFDEPQFTLDIESHLQNSKSYNLVFANTDLELYINE